MFTHTNDNVKRQIQNDKDFTKREQGVTYWGELWEEI
jgi:hypothetical protein